MMKIDIDKIFQTADREKRNYLWSAFIQQTDISLQRMELSPLFKKVNLLEAQIKQSLGYSDIIRENNSGLFAIDLKEQKLIYKQHDINGDIDSWLDDLRMIYLPDSQQKSKEFQNLKEFIYEQTEIMPIGIEQLYKEEGYVFVKYKSDSDTIAYKYHISSLTNARERVNVYLHPVRKFSHSLSYGFDQVKKELNNKSITDTYLNTYLLEASMTIPYEQSLMPIVKGKLWKYLNDLEIN